MYGLKNKIFYCFKRPHCKKLCCERTSGFYICVYIQCRRRRPTNCILVSFFPPKLKFSFQSFLSQQTSSSWTSSWFLSALVAEKSLVFICRENLRRSRILLFPDCPRFCRLMKTRNRRYPRSYGMDGDKSGESGVFLFSRRVPDFCDGRWSFPTSENSNLYRRERRRWISLIANPLRLLGCNLLSQVCVQISTFGTLSISTFNIGRI